ncbi:HTH domain-containing protein [Fulvivirga ulvae]|uniref:HTH domain-containing protein n=1 Tax=Fulvivirga ulvae TaxID=2904245 RepID=UPI001F3FB790|nr:HTH domain-containing protein [Fulvivirga ulvae]UII29938.1 HTH domain-containing protein [Fulvivirga ulvae]
MTNDEKRNLYLRLDRMIRMKYKGNASALANRLGVSRSTFFRCIEEMKSLGAPIYYNELSQQYCYEEDGTFTFGFVRESTL